MTVLEGIHAGMSNKALARHLFVSERTIKAHLTSIYLKTACRTRLEAAALARRAFA
jgi:DNA-binding NarL/FixJ family response regulator